MSPWSAPSARMEGRWIEENHEAGSEVGFDLRDTHSGDAGHLDRGLSAHVSGEPHHRQVHHGAGSAGIQQPRGTRIAGEERSNSGRVAALRWGPGAHRKIPRTVQLPTGRHGTAHGGTARYGEPIRPGREQCAHPRTSRRRRRSCTYCRTDCGPDRIAEARGERGLRAIWSRGEMAARRMFFTRTCSIWWVTRMAWRTPNRSR